MSLPSRDRDLSSQRDLTPQSTPARSTSRNSRARTDVDMYSPTPNGEGQADMFSSVDAAAQEIKRELNVQGEMVRDNRDRVEAMRKQLKRFQQITADNDKEIKALRAERFKMMSEMAEVAPESTIKFASEEDTMRRNFSKSSFLVPHADFSHEEQKELESRVLEDESEMEESRTGSDSDSEVGSVCGNTGISEDFDYEIDSIPSIKQYRSQICEPKAREQDTENIALNISIDYTFGYGIRGVSNNLFWTASRHFVYFVSSFGVVQDPISLEQRHFIGHRQQINCICLHPDGCTVATGEKALEPKVYVWDSSSAFPNPKAAPIQGFHTKGIRSMCFGKDGRYLFIVGCDENNTISMYDWRAGQILCSEFGGKGSILMVRCNLFDGDFATVGPRHMRLWKLVVSTGMEYISGSTPMSTWQKKLKWENGVFGRHGRDKSHTLLCVDFVGPGITVTGSKAGEIFVWKGLVLVQSVQAHRGPVFSLAVTPMESFCLVNSGGKDGRVGSWIYDSSLRISETFVELPNNYQNTVRAMSRHSTTNEILVGTAAGIILKLSMNSDLAWKTVVDGHGRGTLNAISVHSSGQMFVSGGSDAVLYLWQIRHSEALWKCVLANSISSVAYSPDCSRIACGMEKGGGIIVSQTPSKRLSVTSYKWAENLKFPISIISYSPDGGLLAFSCKNKIEIISSNSTRVKLGSFGHHHSSVKSIDWSSDGEYIVSSAENYELLFWSRSSCSPVFASSLAELYYPDNRPSWKTWTSRLGWPVLGLIADNEDENKIASLSRDSTVNRCAVGYIDGNIRLVPYPCETSFGSWKGQKHIGPVSNVVFCTELDEERETVNARTSLLSAGLLDICLCMWKVYKASDELHDVDSNFKNVREQHEEVHRYIELSSLYLEQVASEVDPVLHQEPDEFESVRPFAQSIYPPTSYTYSDLIQHKLQRIRICGLTCLHGDSILLGKRDSTVLYAADGLCIVHNLSPDLDDRIPTQKCFSRHKGSVISMDRHVDQVTVVSCDNGKDSPILIWSMESLMLQSELTVPEGKPCLVSFSQDEEGQFLVVLSVSSRVLIWVWDWRQAEIIAMEIADENIHNKVLCVAQSSFQNVSGFSVLTSGVNHLKLWRCYGFSDSHKKMKMQASQLRTKNEDLPLFLSATFLSQDLFATGSEWGEIYLWKDVSLIKKFQCHAGPIFAIERDDLSATVLTAGREKSIKFWGYDFNLKFEISLEQFLDGSIIEDRRNKSNFCIYSAKWNSLHNRVTFVTSTHDLFHLSFQESTLKEIQYDLCYHHKGKITCIASHPRKLLFASAAEDYTIRIWSMERDPQDPQLLGIIDLPEKPTAICMLGSEQSRLIVGFVTGMITMIEMDQLHGRASLEDFKVSDTVKRSSERVSCLAVSPCETFLACGSADSSIYLFEIARRLEFVVALKGHMGFVSEIDWDVQSRYLQSTSSCEELKFWSLESRREVKRGNEVCDLNWAKFTCRFGWAVQSCIPPVDTSILKVVCRQNVEPYRYFCAGYEDGSIKLFPFPSRNSTFCKSFQAISSNIQHLAFSFDDSLLVVASGNNPILEFFHVAEDIPIPETNDDIESIIRRYDKFRKEFVDDERDTPDTGEDENISVVKPYFKALFPPDNISNLKSGQNNIKGIELDHVYGYRGYDMRNNVFHLKTGEFATLMFGLVVILREDRTQRHFRSHSGPVNCLTAHPNGSLLASADVHKDAKLLMWDVSTFEIKKSLLLKTGTLLDRICFAGPSANLIVALEVSKPMTVHIYDYKSGALLISQPAGVYNVLDLSSSGVESSFVTCGVMHLEFWTFKKGKLISKQAEYRDNLAARTMTCITFVKRGDSLLTATCSIDGYIFLWKENEMQTYFAANSDSIFDIWYQTSSSRFVVGCRNGTVSTFIFQDKNDVPSLQKDFQHEFLYYSCPACEFISSTFHVKEKHVTCQNCDADLNPKFFHRPCIRSISIARGQIVFGTSRNELILGDLVLDAFQFQVVGEGIGCASLSNVLYHPSNETWLFATDSNGELSVIDDKKCKVIKKFLLRDGLDGTEKKDCVLASCQISDDGGFLIAGFCSGILSIKPIIFDKHVVLQPPVRKMLKGSQKGAGLEFVKFSQHQNGERLVCVGFDNGTCELYAITDQLDLTFLSSFGGHDGAIVDITFNDGGQYLMTSSKNHDLLFWETRQIGDKLKVKELKAAECRNIKWKDWSSVIGWHVHALSKLVQSEDKLVAVHTQTGSRHLASIDADGNIRLMPFPAVDPSRVYVERKMLPQTLQSVSLSPSLAYLYVGSRIEGCLSRLRIQKESKDNFADTVDTKRNKCIQFLLDKACRWNEKVLNNKVSVSDNAQVLDQGSNSALMLSLSPEDLSKFRSDAPDSQLEMNFVIGYRGYDSLHSLHFLNSGELFYFTAKLGICMSCDGRRTQRVLSHEGNICLTAVHPDGKTVLTVTNSQKICLNIWNTAQCRVVATINDLPLGNPSAACFSSQDDLLAIATSFHGEFSIFFIDWKRGILLAESEKRTPNPILVLQHNQFSGEFVSGGQGHVCTWKLDGRNMTVASAALDVDEILLCIGFYGSMEGELMIAGNDKGHLRVWLIKAGRTFTLPPTSIPAHKAPVVGVKTDDEHVYSCDLYGEFAIWQPKGKYYLELVSKIELGLSLMYNQPCKVCSNLCCIRGFCVGNVDGVKSCVVGLGSNEIFSIELPKLSESDESKAQLLMSSSNDSLFDVHPDTSSIAFLGANGTIQVWDRERRVRSFVTKFDQVPAALNFSPDGALLAVGLDHGALKFLETDAFDRSWAASEVVKKSISVVKFSPDGLRIAVGYHDGKVFIYSVPRFSKDKAEAYIELKVEGKCEGLAASIQNIDWSLDGRYLQGQTTFFDIIIWDLTQREQLCYSQLRDLQHVTDISWSTTNCILSWYSKGLFLAEMQESKISSLCSCKSSGLAVGYHSGELRTYRFPCLEADAKYSTFNAHGSCDISVVFSKDDRFLFSSGKSDNTLCIWQHLNTLSSDSQGRLVHQALRRRIFFREPKQVSPASRDNEIQAVPPFISSIYAPTKWTADESRKTQASVSADFAFELEYVYGMRHQKLIKLNDDELIYMIASVIVLMNLRTGLQRFFRGHKSTVTAIALHPFEDMVASADTTKGNHVLVWNSISLEVVAKIETSVESMPVAMSFSVDGSNLLACFQGSEDCMISFLWKSNLRESLVRTKCSEILSLASHPNGEMFVTCGVNHLKFWKKRRSQLTKQNADFGTSNKVGMLCVCFTRVDDIFFTITGAQNGYFYIWKDHTLERAVLAHVGPILDVSVADRSMVTCGADGQIRVWEADLKTSSRLNFRELVQELDCLSSMQQCQIISTFPQWVGSGEDQHLDILVLTSNNELVYFKFDGVSGVISSLRESGILMQFHANEVPCSVSTHPSKQKVISVSDDNTLREWSIEQKSQTLFLRLQKPCTTVAYSSNGDVYVGYRDGSICRIDWESSSSETTVSKCSASPIELMKFSHSGKYMACASSDGVLHVLDTTGGYERISSCKLGSRVESFDFSQDESMIQCNSSDQDLSFWSTMTGRRVTRAKEIRDQQWSTWSCKYGWPVHSLHTHLNKIECMKKAKASVLAVGLRDGSWFVTAYPCHQVSIPKDTCYHGHGSAISAIHFTHQDSAFLSIESSEQCMLQWKRLRSESDLSEPSDKPDIGIARNDQFYLYVDQDKWNEEDQRNLSSVAKKVCKFESEEDDVKIHDVIEGSIILHVSSKRPESAISSIISDLRSARGRLWKSCHVRHVIVEKETVDLIRKKTYNADHLLPMAPESSIVSSDLHVSADLTKPYLSSLFNPSNLEHHSKKSLPKPTVDLDLEHVFGYAGENSFSRLILVESGEIVFSAATLIIIYNIERNKQSYFRRHQGMIVDISLHPNKDWIASVDGLPKATIFIWSSSSLEVKACIQLTNHFPIVCISFSGDGENVMVVAKDNEYRLSVIDWKKNTPIDKTIIENKKILSMTSFIAEFSDDNKFVTCGLDHIQFWSLVRGKIRLHPCYGDKTLIQSKHFIKAVFASQHCVVAGTDCGGLFIFRFASVGATVARVIVKAHDGPIFDLWSNEYVCLTAGKDGTLRTWNVVTRVGKDYDLQYLKEYLTHDSSHKVPLPSTRSVTFLQSTDQIVVGTSDNRLTVIEQDSHKVKWLNQGHSAGALLALATHPLDPAVFLTAGSDCRIHLWDAEVRSKKQSWRCRTAVFSVDFMSSGDSFAAGLSDGSVILYFDYEEPNLATVEVTSAFGPVRTLKFSPNKKMLAVGHEQGVINVYELYGRNCEHFYSFKGHTSSITEIDWDLSSRYLRSTSISLELFFWEVGSKSRVGKVIDIKDINWITYNCTIGWYSAGLISSTSDERDILSSDRSEDLSLLAVSRNDGRIQLLPFPCHLPDHDSVSIFAHLPAAAKVKFTCDSRRLISIGGNDDAVMVWRIRSTYIDQAMKQVFDVPDSFVKAHMRNHMSTDYTAHDKEFIEIDFQLESKTDDLQTFLQLHHVYGSSNLYNQKSFHRAKDKVLFASASICVVHDLHTDEQEFFLRHQNFISALAVHPDGRLVASGEFSLTPSIIFWDLEQLETIAILDANTMNLKHDSLQVVRLLSFSPTGAQLAVLCGFDRRRILIIDWAMKKLTHSLSFETTVTECAFSPLQSFLVTCCQENVKFWTFKKEAPLLRNASFGKNFVNQQMTSIAFVAKPGLRMSDSVQVTITGSIDGSVYLFGMMVDGRWKFNVVSYVVKAHDGPVMDVDYLGTPFGFASCGKDGMIRHFMLKYDLNPSDKNVEVLTVDDMESLQVKDILHDQSGQELYIKELATSDDLQLFKTSRDQIIRYDLRSKAFKQIASSARGAVSSMCCHPDLPILVTVDRGGSIMVWESNSHILLFSHEVGSPLRCVDFSPDGGQIAVANDQGDVMIFDLVEYDCSTLSQQFQSSNRNPNSPASATVLRFSRVTRENPYLAVGYDNGDIEVYVKDQTQYRFLERTSKDFDYSHKSEIKALDWSFEPLFLRSMCLSDKVNIWGPLPSLNRHETGKESDRIQWFDNSCVSSYKHELLDSLKSTVRSTDRKTHFTLNADGEIFLHNNPEKEEEFLLKCYTCSALSTKQIELSPDNEFFFTFSDEDCCILAWRCLQKKELIHAHLGAVMSNMYNAATDEVSYLTPLDSNKRQVQTRGKPSEKLVRKPRVEMTLEHVYGCNSSMVLNGAKFVYNRRGLKSDPTRENVSALYFSSGVSILQSLGTPGTSPVDLGLKNILCQATSHDGLLIATAELASSPQIVVWRLTDRQVLKRFQGFTKGGIAILCFAEQSEMLFSICCDDFNTVALFDLNSEDSGGPPVSAHPGGYNRIIAACSTSLRGLQSFITVGINHVRCWRLISDDSNKRSLTYRKFSTGAERSIVFCSVCSFDQLIFCGTNQGSIYLFKDFQTLKVFKQVHTISNELSCPVFVLYVLSQTEDGISLISGGGDSLVKFWMLKGMELEAEEKVMDMFELSQKAKNLNSRTTSFCKYLQKHINLAVTTFDRVFVKESGEVKPYYLVGTNCNELFLIDHLLKNSLLLAQAHSSRISCLSSHISRNISASVSSDLTMRIWDNSSRVMSSLFSFDRKPFSVAWSPKTTSEDEIVVGAENGAFFCFTFQAKHGTLKNTLVRSMDETQARKDFVLAKFSPDAKFLALASSCGNIDVFDVSRGYVHLGVCDGNGMRPQVVQSIDWSKDSDTLVACLSEVGLLFWKIHAEVSNNMFEMLRRFDFSNKGWTTWSNLAGWFVEGLLVENGGGIIKIDCQQKVDLDEDKLTLGKPGSHDVALAAYRDSVMRLFRFPAIKGAKSTMIAHPSQSISQLTFGNEGKSCLTTSRLTIFEWRLVDERSDAKLQGQEPKGKTKEVEEKLREAFWQLTETDLDDLRRRGISSEQLRLVPADHLNNPRAKVLLFTFDAVALHVLGWDGRTSFKDPVLINLASNPTWHEMLETLAPYDKASGEKSNIKHPLTFMYEKFEINHGDSIFEISEPRLKHIHQEAHSFEISRIKNESRRMYVVRNEFDFRQCWLWMEQEYRWLLSVGGVVPEHQCFEISIYLTKNRAASTEDEDSGYDSDLETIINEYRLVRNSQENEQKTNNTEVMPSSITQGEVPPPTGWDEIPEVEKESLRKPPKVDLVLDHIMGYSCGTCKDNAAFLRNDEVVYSVGCCAVIYDRLKNSQRHFLQHTQKILSLAVDLSSTLIATGGMGRSAEFLVWNPFSMLVMANFGGVHQDYVSALSFSTNKPWIVSAGGSSNQDAILVHDYRSKALLFQTFPPKPSIQLAVGFNPNITPKSVLFVTAGIRQTVFWKFENEKLIAIPGKSGSRASVKTMLCICFPRDGEKELVLTGGKDGKVYLWKNMSIIYEIIACKGPVFSLRTHGDLVFGGGKDSISPLRCWKLSPSWPVDLRIDSVSESDPFLNPYRSSDRQADKRSVCVKSLSFNGSDLLVGTSYNDLFIMNTDSRISRALAVGGSNSTSTAVAVHPSKPLFAFSFEDGTILINNTNEKMNISRFSMKEAITAIAFAPSRSFKSLAMSKRSSDRIAIGCRTGEFQIREAATFDLVDGLAPSYGIARCRMHSVLRKNTEITVLAYSPCGRFLAVGAGDGILDFYDVNNGYEHVQSCEEHGGAISAIDWSESEEFPLYAQSSSAAARALRRWEVTQAGDAHVVREIEPASVRDEPWRTWTQSLGWHVKGLLPSALGWANSPLTCSTRSFDRRMIASGNKEGNILLFHFPCVHEDAMPLQASQVHRSQVQGLSFAPDGRKLVSLATSDAFVALWETRVLVVPAEAEGVPSHQDELLRNSCTFASFSRGFELFAAVVADVKVSVWQQTSDGALERKDTFEVRGDSINSCEISSNKVLCTTSREHKVRLYDLKAESPMEVECIEAHDDQVYNCCFSPDGAVLATCGADKLVNLWRLTDSLAVSKVGFAAGHRKSVLSVAISDDSNLLCTASEDKTLRVWDLTGIRQADLSDPLALPTTCRLRGHEDAVVCCAFSPATQRSEGGVKVCSGSWDGSLIMWDVQSAVMLLKLRHSEALLGCSFSCCGNFISSICLDNSLRLWNVSDVEQVQCVQEAKGSTKDSKLIIGSAFAAGRLVYALASNKSNIGKPVVWTF